jgi:hypothetical protein
MVGSGSSVDPGVAGAGFTAALGGMMCFGAAPYLLAACVYSLMLCCREFPGAANSRVGMAPVTVTGMLSWDAGPDAIVRC